MGKREMIDELRNYGSVVAFGYTWQVVGLRINGLEVSGQKAAREEGEGLGRGNLPKRASSCFG
jgi:hypothetical protein